MEILRCAQFELGKAYAWSMRLRWYDVEVVKTPGQDGQGDQIRIQSPTTLCGERGAVSGQNEEKGGDPRSDSNSFKDKQEGKANE